MRARGTAMIAGPVVLIGLIVAALLAARVPSCPQPARSLPALLERLPCPASGRVVYNLRDDRGTSMQVLDPIADPAGGYLGVYHTLVQPWSPAGGIYEVLLAHSSDLIHWHELAVLDDRNAAMPTLRAVPGGAGFLLADEKAAGPVGGHVVRLAYYPSRAALLRARAAAAIDLPLRYSPLNNGTPSIRAIQWSGSLPGSKIELGFHYQLAGSGIDREALGTLVGWRRWDTYRDRRLDTQLDAQGLVGSHGDRREFAFGHSRWRIFEASATPAGFATWHVLLDQVSNRDPVELRFHTAAGVFSSSFGNPVVDVLPAPRGGGKVLVMTMFVFGQGPAAREAGELLFYWPVS